MLDQAGLTMCRSKSTIAIADMLSRPRTVIEGVTMWADAAAPSRIGPTGTPPEVVQRVNREMDAILKDPEVIARLRQFGFYNNGAESTEAVGAFIRAELAAWGKVVKAIGIEPE